MSRILITGAGGFVGANLVRDLVKSKHNVSIVVRRQSNLWRLKDVLSHIGVNHVDMTDIAEINKVIKKTQPDIVYHLAAHGGYPFQQDLDTIIKTNLISSVNLMHALSNHCNQCKFINTGSSSEYGPKQRAMRESDVTDPISVYGITKLSQTLFAKYFNKKYNMHTVTLRLFSVYGPYEEPGRLIHDIMMALVNKKELKLSSPKPRRDFIHMDDVISALKKAALVKGAKGKVFNIGSGRDYSVRDALDIACKVTDTKLKVKWGIEEKSRSFNSNSKWIADITNANKILKWKPVIPFREGLLKTYEWYYNNVKIYANR
ncbi:MAG: NAD(P)-dependent oxidoreductase [Thaumarchaeota archaeon]|nr:NAD(P)-dependent oxidoreductase [Nitrososphaerota archaeon]